MLCKEDMDVQDLQRVWFQVIMLKPMKLGGMLASVLVMLLALATDTETETKTTVRVFHCVSTESGGRGSHRNYKGGIKDD